MSKLIFTNDIDPRPVSAGWSIFTYSCLDVAAVVGVPSEPEDEKDNVPATGERMKVDTSTAPTREA
ncbi:hypothetical protein ADL01_20260 [Streptomyces sp. NRRL WC-3618]|nr:hypothetical protein ADL01_20260 [Streptomyces sp. NRRL WC-3618]